MVVSALNLKRNLYLFHQVKDFGIPVILAVNMVDVAGKRGISLNSELLSQKLGCPVYKISAKSGEGLPDLKAGVINNTPKPESKISDYVRDISSEKLTAYANENNFITPFHAFLDLVKYKKNAEVKSLSGSNISAHKLRVNESIIRYKVINSYFPEVYQEDKNAASDLTARFDKLFLHPIWGYVIFFVHHVSGVSVDI